MASTALSYVSSEDLGGMPFLEAAEVWLATKVPYISPKTFHEYELNISTLSKFFSDVKLKDIGADQIRAYQKHRSAQCGAFSINHECSVLQQILKRIGLWHLVAPNYEPLPLPKELVGRAITADEKTRLFEVAQGDPNLEAAFLFAMISVNTTAGPKETATLRLKDVDLDGRVISIQTEGAKNAGRIRPIPLNLEAWRAVKLAIARAKRLGAVNPEHYLFPFRIHRSLFDPCRHQTTFKTGWKKILAKAGINGRLRMYDLRHTAMTVLLEDPRVSEETVESIAGHLSHRMKKVYSHVRMAARRQAVSALDGSPAPGASDVSRIRPENSLTNEIVVEMLTVDELPARIVIAKIRKAEHCLFDTSREALKKLIATGVPDAVILAMVKA